MNHEYFDYKDVKLPIKIVSSRNYKRISISVNKNYIRLSKPERISKNRANEFLLENKEKIYEIYRKIQVDNKEEILIFGTLRKLNYVYWNFGQFMLDLNDDEILFYIPNSVNDSECYSYFISNLKSFLKENTKILLEKRLIYWCNIMNERYNSLSIKCQKTVWGSAVKSKRSLNFNLKLAMLPSHVADYIIVHELCHFKEPNHSQKFWNLVEKYIPDYNECKKYLKDNIRYFDII